MLLPILLGIRGLKNVQKRKLSPSRRTWLQCPLNITPSIRDHQTALRVAFLVTAAKQSICGLVANAAGTAIPKGRVVVLIVKIIGNVIIARWSISSQRQSHGSLLVCNKWWKSMSLYSLYTYHYLQALLLIIFCSIAVVSGRRRTLVIALYAFLAPLQRFGLIHWSS